MTTFRIAFQLWRDGGQVGRLRGEVDRALAAAAEALEILTSTE
jgi:hypothetical protein